MKKKISNLIIICVIAFISILILLFVGLKIYTKNNYDMKVITNSGRSFFIVDTTKKEYYLLNSQFKTKVRAKNFDADSNDLSESEIRHLKDLETEDQMFSYTDNDHSFFIKGNTIYYRKTQNYSGEEIINESLQTVYKFDTESKEITVFLQGYDNEPNTELKTAVLQKLYPGLEKAITKKCKNGFNCEECYYHNGRIIFETCRSTSAKGTTSCLYEYLPNSKKTKKIAAFNSDVIDVVFEK